MKRLYLIGLFSLVIIGAWAMVSEYSFYSSLGVYHEITDGTIHGTSANDNGCFLAIPIGFTFTYNGVDYNTVSIATNGFIAMGDNVVTSNMAISSSTSTNNVVAALNRDIKSRDNGSLMTQSSGTAPDRVFTVQWTHYRRVQTSTANDDFSFQIKLHENGSNVQFVYGTFTAVTAINAAAIQVGLRGESNADFNNRTTTTDWSATTAGTANNNSCTLSAPVFPALGLTFTFSLLYISWGNLTGSVTDSESNYPVAGVTVSFANSALSTTTAADGTYGFPHIMEGVYDVSATKHGYHVATHSLTIVEDQTTIQNFEITLLEQVSVSGRIVGSDNPSVGLSGATITLGGYENYLATTDTYGQFTINNVYGSHTYQYVAQHPGFYDYTSDIAVGNTNLDMGDVVLNEFAFPPDNVVATDAADFNNVLINWDAPDYNVQSKNEGFSADHDPEESRALLGYQVWRMLAMNQDDESTWTLLTPTMITDTAYTDSTWQPLPSSAYKFAVKAVYPDNVLSIPSLSNVLYKGMMVTFTGAVTDFGTNTPIAGAIITAGAHSRSTNAQGIYSFDIYPGIYHVTAFKPGYQSWSQDGVAISGMQTTTLNIQMYESACPPHTVIAAEADNFGNVVVTWNEPDTGGEAWLHYDSGENDSSIGTGDVADFDVAIRYPGSALQDYLGTSLQAVKVWPAQSGTFSLRVWTGGTPDAPGTMVVDQTFTPTLDTYNTVVLANHVPVTGTEELWFGYRCNVTSGYPAGCDAGPATDGFGNMMYYQGAWSTLREIAPGLNYNWNIQGYVGYEASVQAAQLTTIPFNADRYTIGLLSSTGLKKGIAATPADPSGTNRIHLGYKLWRLTEGQENNPGAWNELTSTSIIDTTFTDNNWLSCDLNVPYRWAVKAIYTGDINSQAIFSNTQFRHVAPMAPVNVIISVVGNLLILDWDDVTQDMLGNPMVPSYYAVYVGDTPDFPCSFDTQIGTAEMSYMELADVVDYAERLFFKVVAVSGAIRMKNEELRMKRP